MFIASNTSLIERIFDLVLSEGYQLEMGFSKLVEIGLGHTVECVSSGLTRTKSQGTQGR